MIKKNAVRIEGAVNNKTRVVLLKDENSIHNFLEAYIFLIRKYAEKKKLSGQGQNRIWDITEALMSKKYSEFKLQPEWFAWIKKQFSASEYQQSVQQEGQYYNWSVKHQLDEA